MKIYTPILFTPLLIIICSCKLSRKIKYDNYNRGFFYLFNSHVFIGDKFINSPLDSIDTIKVFKNKISYSDYLEYVVRFNFQRMFLASNILQIPFNNQLFEDKNINILRKRTNNVFRKKYHSNNLYTDANDQPFINDIMFFSPPPGCYLNLTVNRIDELSSIKNLPYFFYIVNFSCCNDNRKISYTCINNNELNLPVINYTYAPTITDHYKKDTTNLYYDPLNIKLYNYVIAIPKSIPFSYNLIKEHTSELNNIELINMNKNQKIPNELTPLYSPTLPSEILYLSKEFLSFDYSKEQITSQIFYGLIPRCNSEEERINALNLTLKILLFSEFGGQINQIQFLKKTIKYRYQEYTFCFNSSYKAKIKIGPNFLPQIFYKKIGELKYTKL